MESQEGKEKGIVEELERYLSERDKVISAKSSEIEKLTEKSASLKKELDGLKNTIAEKESRLSDSANKIAKLEAKIDELKGGLEEKG